MTNREARETHTNILHTKGNKAVPAGKGQI